MTKQELLLKYNNLPGGTLWAATITWDIDHSIEDDMEYDLPL